MPQGIELLIHQTQPRQVFVCVDVCCSVRASLDPTRHYCWAPVATVLLRSIIRLKDFGKGRLYPLERFHYAPKGP